MQQGVLAVYCFNWKSEGSIGKLISKRFGRYANLTATFQNTVFAEQDDVWSIIMLKVPFDVASLAPFQMIFEHLDR